MKERRFRGLSLICFAFACIQFISGALTRKHSISGVSSGGSMAADHMMAFSGVVEGCGIVAGSPYGCGALSNEGDACYYNTNGSLLKSMDELNNYTLKRAAKHEIDDLKNLEDIPLYLYSGKSDTVVYQSEMKATATYFSKFMKKENMQTVWNIDSEHGYITDGYGECCRCRNGTYIHNCDYDQAGAILQHIYGVSTLQNKTTAVSSNLKEISQRKYFTGSVVLQAQMAERGHVYVPAGCAKDLDSCKIHVNYHGCGAHGTTVPVHSGFNAWAEANDIIIVYPQASRGLGNLGGCWDWTGVTGSNFDTKQGAQLSLVVKMINDLKNAIIDSEENDDDDGTGGGGGSGDDTQKPSSDSLTLELGLGLGVPVFLLVSFGLFTYFKRRSRRKQAADSDLPDETEPLVKNSL